MKNNDFFCCEKKRSIANEPCGEISCDDCFMKSFWLDILKEKDVHFVSDKLHSKVGLYGVNFLQFDLDKEGGFGNRLFRVELSNGVVYDGVKLWSNGFAPNDYVVEELGFGSVESFRGE